MDDIDLLEHGGGGPLRIVCDGERYLLPDPADIEFQRLLLILQERHIPGLPRMAEWKRRRVFERWAVHYDLPEFQSAHRLAYLVDHYRSGIVYDLRVFANVDLGELWRSRRWRTLLDLIDHLPAHSWYSATVSMDEEYAAMMAEQILARQDAGEEKESSGPSLTTWTPEVSYLARIEDAVRYTAWATFAAQAGKAAGEPPKPGPRPITPLERALKQAEHRKRKAAHEALVARVLPKKTTT